MVPGVCEAEPREVAVVVLLLQRSALLDGAGLDQFGELRAESGDIGILEPVVEPDDERVADVAGGVVVAVEAEDVLDGIGRVFGEVVEVLILRADEFLGHQRLAHEAQERGPVVVPLPLHEHDRDHRGLAGLHEGQRLVRLVHGAEATGEARDRFGLREEHEFACEEVAEVDELLIAGDDGVGGRLEGESDGDAERGLAPGALVSRLHDAVASAGDRHPSGIGHESAEVACRGVIGMVRRCACGAEDGDLVGCGVLREDAVRVAQLLQRGGHELQLTRVALVRDQFEAGGEQVFDEATVHGRGVAPDRSDQIVEFRRDLRGIGPLVGGLLGEEPLALGRGGQCGVEFDAVVL